LDRSLRGLALVLLGYVGLGLFDHDSVGSGSYLLIFLLIAGDAVIPILPGETTLNTAAVLASQGELVLLLVIIAGALGAIVGDSLVYWMARLGKGQIERRLGRFLKGKRASKAVEAFRRNGPGFIVVGRYLPGMRLVINFAAGGILHMPYKKFLLWSSIGGVTWAAYTATLAYLVGSALAGYPIASIIVSGAITTVGLAVIHRRTRHRTEKPEAAV
jgi:membrane-associated protein